MAKNKRQHYVPQMYLRNFSQDGRTLYVYSKGEGRLLTSSGQIARQCQKNYLYSRDLRYESSLCDIEAAASPVLSDVISKNRMPRRSTVEYGHLLVFVMIQSARTLGYIRGTDESFGSMLKEAVRAAIQQGGVTDLTESDLEDVSIKPTESALLYLRTAVMTVPLLFDLQARLIVNETADDFFTSDDPVILNNYAFSGGVHSYLGFASKGLVIMFPLSPRHYLVLFDPNIYRVGGRRI